MGDMNDYRMTIPLNVKQFSGIDLIIEFTGDVFYNSFETFGSPSKYATIKKLPTIICCQYKCGAVNICSTAFALVFSQNGTMSRLIVSNKSFLRRISAT